jgi:predicted ATPase
LAYAAESKEVAAEHGFSFWLAGAAVLSGWALAASGRGKEGLERLRQGLADWNATGSRTYLTYYLGVLSEVLASQGQIDEARQTVENALALAQSTGEGLYEAELHRLKGEYLLQGTNATDAEAVRNAESCFHHSIDLARRRHAKALEQRTLTSLARLQPSQGAPAAGKAACDTQA